MWLVCSHAELVFSRGGQLYERWETHISRKLRQEPYLVASYFCSSAVGYFQSIMSFCSLKIFKIAIHCEPHAHANYLNIIILLEATCMSRLQLIAHDLHCSYCWFIETLFCWSNVNQINPNLSILYDISGLILHRLSLVGVYKYVRELHSCETVTQILTA